MLKFLGFRSALYGAAAERAAGESTLTGAAGAIARLLWKGLQQRRPARARLGRGHKHRTLEVEGATQHVDRANSSQVNGGRRGRANSISLSSSAGTTFRSAAHRLFVDNVLRRVTNTQVSNLRQRTARQLFSGNATPFLALVGVSLASGTGIITKEDEVECVCREVRRAAAKASSHLEKVDDEDHDEINVEHTTLSNFHFGPVIAKGCSAVVYAAKWAANKAQHVSQGFQDMGQTEPYPLAIKMMFNFHAESNALTILKAMHRETVVAQTTHLPEEMSDFYGDEGRQTSPLPAHPNIVDMYTVFTDHVPELQGSMDLYPDALPRRINPSGYGRNMSLFLVMKRYDCSLRQYLDGKELPWKSSLFLLTQLLEGISHLGRHNMVHRDLKSDNLLLLGIDKDLPHLVITDFGCCLKGSTSLHYTSHEVDRGGNAALMPPEVATAKPGLFTYIDYGKADAWAAGTIAYEMFGLENPFYDNLDTRNYTQMDLPQLPDHLPSIVHQLVRDLLSRSPCRRLSAETAATICQLLLWAPRKWLEPQSGRAVATSQDVLQWLLTMTTKVLYESRFATDRSIANREYQLVATFLSRVSVQSIKTALLWIRDQN